MFTVRVSRQHSLGWHCLMLTLSTAFGAQRQRVRRVRVSGQQLSGCSGARGGSARGCTSRHAPHGRACDGRWLVHSGGDGERGRRHEGPGAARGVRLPRAGQAQGRAGLDEGQCVRLRGRSVQCSVFCLYNNLFVILFVSQNERCQTHPNFNLQNTMQVLFRFNIILTNFSILNY